jgi:hypothetical protein
MAVSGRKRQCGQLYLPRTGQAFRRVAIAALMKLNFMSGKLLDRVTRIGESAHQPAQHPAAAQKRRPAADRRCAAQCTAKIHPPLSRTAPALTRPTSAAFSVTTSLPRSNYFSSLLSDPGPGHLMLARAIRNFARCADCHFASLPRGLGHFRPRHFRSVEKKRHKGTSEKKAIFVFAKVSTAGRCTITRQTKLESAFDARWQPTDVRWIAPAALIFRNRGSIT